MQWKGLPPEEHEWLTGSKLKNATDVVQDHLNELSRKGRPAARVGGPDSVAAQADNAVSQDKTDSEGTLLQSQSSAEGAQGRPAILRLLRSAAEASLGSSVSVVPLAAMGVCPAVATASLSGSVCLFVKVVCVHIYVVRGQLSKANGAKIWNLDC